MAIVDDRNILSPLLMKYKAEFDEDFTLNILNIKEKCLMMPGLKSKYVMTYLNERKVLNVLKAQKNELVQKYIDKHLGPGRIVSTLKINAEKLDSIKSLTAKIAIHQDVVDFLAGLKDIASFMDGTIKSVVEILKLEHMM